MDKNKILLSIAAMIFGVLLSGFAFSTKLGHPTSTVCLLSGVTLAFGGAFFLFIMLVKKMILLLR
ncbi:hypothetical protein [Flavobacterium microcysteis]